MDISLLKEKSLMDLREIAKMAGIKSVTKYRKSELLDMLYELDRQGAQRGNGTATGPRNRSKLLWKRWKSRWKSRQWKSRPEKMRAIFPPISRMCWSAATAARGRGITIWPVSREMVDEKKIIEYVMGNDAVNELLNKGDCGDAMGILEVLPEGYGFFAQRELFAGQ